MYGETADIIMHKMYVRDYGMGILKHLESQTNVKKIIGIDDKTNEEIDAMTNKERFKRVEYYHTEIDGNNEKFSNEKYYDKL